MTPKQRLYVAVDTPALDRAEALARSLRDSVGGIKLGKEFFTAHGPDGVRRVVDAAGLPLFLDLKFHDIPNTVAGAVRAALRLRPAILNVHASGGREMMAAARAAADDAPDEAGPMLIAVTVLTSLSDADLAETGVDDGAEAQVLRLARLSRAAGLDGVVCSPKEISSLRGALRADFKLVVPGIRPDWAATGDQKRVMTPRQALDLGADVLVVGRPITGSDDPAEAAARLVDEMR